MGMIKPWHIVVTTLACLLPLAAVIVAGVWAVRRSKRERGPGSGTGP